MIFPPMPDEFLPTTDRTRTRERHRAFFRKCCQHIESVQCGETARAELLQLSYFPIAKNILWIAAAILTNLGSDRKTVIVSGNQLEEKKLHRLGHGDWNPWLWSRIPRGQLHNVGEGIDEVELGWTLYFDGINTRSESVPPSSYGVRINLISPRNRRILRMAACVSYVFRLRSEVREIVEDKNRVSAWPADEKVLGIHLRRGDSATEDLSKTNRFSRTLEEYLHCADRFHDRYGISTIYLSTESEVEIEKAKSLRPNYQFIHQEYDRSFFPKAAQLPIDIEAMALKDPSIVEPIISSALVDLHYLASSSAFIGAFNSEFSTLAWLLCIGDKGHIMPYVNLAPRSILSAKQGRLYGCKRPLYSPRYVDLPGDLRTN